MVIARETHGNAAAIEKSCWETMPRDGAFFCTEEAAKLLLLLGEPTPLEPCKSLGGAPARACVNDIHEFMCNQMLQCDTPETATKKT